jgi:hypothetical protein
MNLGTAYCEAICKQFMRGPESSLTILEVLRTYRLELLLVGSRSVQQTVETRDETGAQGTGTTHEFRHRK